MTHFMRFLRISRRQWLWMVGGIVLGVAVIAANTILMALSGWFIASMAVAGVSGNRRRSRASPKSAACTCG